jgi:DNA-binding MarR family transcriptional regulator
MELWTALLVAHRRLTVGLDAELMERVGMSLDEYDVLLQIRLVGDAVRMSDLSGRLLISRASTTRSVDRLVQRGWVERLLDEGDRRVVRVRLTVAGRTAQSRAAAVHLDGIARLVDGPVAGTDVAAAVDTLRRLATT